MGKSARNALAIHYALFFDIRLALRLLAIPSSRPTPTHAFIRGAALLPVTRPPPPVHTTDLVAPPFALRFLKNNVGSTITLLANKMHSPMHIPQMAFVS